MYFKLLATIITLAAVTTAIQPLHAQRNKAENNKSSKVSTREKVDRVVSKPTYRDEAIEKNATRQISRTNVERNPIGNKAEKTTNKSRQNQSEQNRINQKSEKTKYSDSNNSRSADRGNSKTNSATYGKNTPRNDVASNEARNTNDRRTTSYSGASSSGRSYAQAENRDMKNIGKRENSKSIHEKYNTNATDIRYKPNKNYKGNKQYWSSEIRNPKYKHGNNNVAFHVDINYWDRHWENYRWNQNSWVNYYGNYNPYSYKNNRYYYYHNYYGHVIRKFAVQPQIFVHAGIPYYYFEGNFFSYRKWVGYVMVDMPFGTVFDYLPDGYELVTINGYPYYRSVSRTLFCLRPCL